MHSATYAALHLGASLGTHYPRSPLVAVWKIDDVEGSVPHVETAVTLPDGGLVGERAGGSGEAQGCEQVALVLTSVYQ